ncbi:MFS transporter [Neobacillus kokaensis]|uniref:Major facilitator superfamily (MFS) profile domain-containing protein n=1 Tax=Neobacillus kokaensis TaxID=2759023 RepID=A0ABQ3N9A2_9BACI|nr:MFS transporter [Neobacillus kokaensis]GHI00807.1 hypothetical protein AM1BK_43490 [Neobacillus kokaensis]
MAGRVNLSAIWLVSKGRIDEALEIMQKLFGSEVELEREEIKKTRYSKIFKKGYFKRMMFVGTIWACQVVPMFGLYTFGPQILGAFGLDAGKKAILGDVVISMFFLIGCIPAMFWLNSIGRRSLLIGSFAIMSISLAVLWIFPNMVGTAITVLGLVVSIAMAPETKVNVSSIKLCGF